MQTQRNKQTKKKRKKKASLCHANVAEACVLAVGMLVNAVGARRMVDERYWSLEACSGGGVIN